MNTVNNNFNHLARADLEGGAMYLVIMQSTRYIPESRKCADLVEVMKYTRLMQNMDIDNECFIEIMRVK
jgi:hypothetical protein